MLPIVVIAALAIVADPLKPGDHTRTVDVDGTKREYLVHVPKKYDAANPTPVVLVFHGGGSFAEVTVRFTGMSEKADSSGFIAVYPSGSGRLPRALTWNGGNCCGYAMVNNIDDVTFVRKLLDDLASAVNVDARRVFATGISNGGILAYRLASDLSDRIAAIAPVGGPMGTETCHPKRPVPVMHFHGTDDEFAPYKGGRGKGTSGTNFYSVEHSIQAWIKANGCAAEPQIIELPDTANDGTKITQQTHKGGKAEAEVVLVTIHGGGHTWPGQQPRIESLGKSTKNISANDLMWEFFQRHPLP